jgi:flagellar hook protein FlgE
MSLSGALFAGVSGLTAQGSKIGIISDNIANVNTIGYKEAEAVFESLVVNTNNASSYSPGGVLSSSRLQIDQQGLLQSTNSPTDLAISGGGLFSVNSAQDGRGTSLFTRAGSFRQDSLGNFINASGYYLQGWRLDADGKIPADNSSLSSLSTVNVETVSGVAAGTSNVAIGANLKASQATFSGSGITGGFDVNSTLNASNAAADIIIPDATAGNQISRNDRFEVNIIDDNETYTFRYGGFVIGRNILNGNVGDGNQTSIATSANVAIGGVAATNANAFVDVTIANHGLSTGDVVTLSGLTTAIATIPVTEINGTRIIEVRDANTIRITTTTAANADAVSTEASTAAMRVYAGNVLDASGADQVFFNSTAVTDYSTAARSFTISTASSGTVTFTYTTSSPSAALGQFNTLNNLADAIDLVNGLTARVSGGQLYVAPEDANEAMTFANGDDTANAGPPLLRGINWIRELDLINQSAAVSGSDRRFNTLSGLAAKVNAISDLEATLTNKLTDSSINISLSDPLKTISFTEPTLGTVITETSDILSFDNTTTVQITSKSHGLIDGDIITLAGIEDDDGVVDATLYGIPLTELNTTHTVTRISDDVFEITTTTAANATNTGGYGVTDITITPADNNGSILSEIFDGKGGIQSLDGAAYDANFISTNTSGILGPEYSASTSSSNMASGAITPHFSRNVRVFDSQGSGHDMQFSYLKIGINTWAVEIHAVPATDISSQLINGQVATGTVSFNGDGSLASVSQGLSQPITVIWQNEGVNDNGASASTITFGFGTAGAQANTTTNTTNVGLTDGLTQFDANYNVTFVEQNGAQVGQLVGVTIDSNGFVIASFTNGETQALYKLPLADFSNPNGLQAISGNVYAQSEDSGEVNLREAGTNGTGTLVSAALEASNVDLSSQLTEMIIAQRSYQANTRVISTTDELLEQLNQI